MIFFVRYKGHECCMCVTKAELETTGATHKQCWVALQHFQGCHPGIRPEYSELLRMIGPDDPTPCWWACEQ